MKLVLLIFQLIGLVALAVVAYVLWFAFLIVYSGHPLTCIVVLMGIVVALGLLYGLRSPLPSMDMDGDTDYRAGGVGAEDGHRTDSGKD
jgi:hypothetical protein